MPATFRLRRGDNRKVPGGAERFEAIRGRALWLGKAVAWIAVTAGAAALALLGLREGLRYATTSERFALDEIAVSGDLGPGAQLTAADLRARSGLVLGENVFRAKLDEARARLEKNPWLRSVRLARELPRRVRIEVEQRRAVAYVELGGLYLLDDRGQVFKRAAAEDALDLPVITGLSRQDFITGSAPLREELELALSFVAPPHGAPLPWEPGELSEVHWDRDLGLSLELGAGPTEVQLGFPPFDEKLERLRRTRGELSRRALKAAALYLDDSRQKDQVGVALAGVDPLANTAAP